ncbi:MAG TPA: hypothetical protein VGC74_13885 [Stenotrophomonas sp.]|jgi:hypothetical protein
MILAVLMAASAMCAPEQARYVLREDPAITARFLTVEASSDWPSGIALRLHSSRTGKDYDFLPWSGGSDGAQHLASTGDVTAPHWGLPSPDDGAARPLGDVTYIATDEHYTLLAVPPGRGVQAPAHILIPDLREALWYRTGPDARESTTKQFFDRVGCDH